MTTGGMQPHTLSTVMWLSWVHALLRASTTCTVQHTEQWCSFHTKIRSASAATVHATVLFIYAYAQQQHCLCTNLLQQLGYRHASSWPWAACGGESQAASWNRARPQPAVARGYNVCTHITSGGNMP